MDRKKLLLALVLLWPAIGSNAQQALEYTQTDPETEVGARIGAGIETAIIPKTMNLSVEEMLYVDNNFGRLKRSYTTLAVDYTVLPWLKAQASYSFIMNNSSSSWGMRHRVAVSLTETVRSDRWKFAFREKLQLTHNDSVNVYQEPANALALKLRTKVSYDLPNSHFTPFASAEARFALNAVNPGKFVYTSGTGRWSNTDPVYNHFYFNRMRLNVGTSYKTPAKNTLDLFLIADLGYDLDIDFNSKGKQKKNDDTGSYEPYMYLENSYFFGIGLTFNFKI